MSILLEDAGVTQRIQNPERQFTGNLLVIVRVVGGIACVGGGYSAEYCGDQNYSGSGDMFQESISEKSYDSIAGLALAGINYRFQLFSSSALLAGQITGISLKAMNSSKEV